MGNKKQAWWIVLILVMLPWLAYQVWSTAEITAQQGVPPDCLMVRFSNIGLPI
jgi:hypothetical protein